MIQPATTKRFLNPQICMKSFRGPRKRSAAVKAEPPALQSCWKMLLTFAIGMGFTPVTKKFAHGKKLCFARGKTTRRCTVKATGTAMTTVTVGSVVDLKQVVHTYTPPVQQCVILSQGSSRAFHCAGHGHSHGARSMSSDSSSDDEDEDQEAFIEQEWKKELQRIENGLCSEDELDDSDVEDDDGLSSDEEDDGVNSSAFVPEEDYFEETLSFLVEQQQLSYVVAERVMQLFRQGDDNIRAAFKVSVCVREQPLALAACFELLHWYSALPLSHGIMYRFMELLATTVIWSKLLQSFLRGSTKSQSINPTMIAKLMQ